MPSTGPFDHYCELGERVIDQARRRMLQGEQVPNAEKIYSSFEAHTDLLQAPSPSLRTNFVFLQLDAKLLSLTSLLVLECARPVG